VQLIISTNVLKCPTITTHIATSYLDSHTQTHMHTHPFNGHLSGTTRVSWYQKGKNNLDFTEARVNERQWHQPGHMQICTLLQTNNQTSTPPLSFFTGRMPFLPPNQQCQSTGGNHIWPVTINITGRTIQHTHPFSSPLSGTTQVSQYQKGKNNLDFTEARETVSGSGISWTIFKSAPRSRQITIQHTYTRLTALCPGLPGSASTRKVKTIWILLKQERQ